MRSSARIALHPEPASGGTALGVVSTDVGVFFEVTKQDIEAVEYSEMRINQKLSITRLLKIVTPIQHAYPDPSIVKLIHRCAQMDNSAPTTVSTIPS